MRDEFDALLHTSFPVLFKNKPYPECGDGWFDIIFSLSKEIEEYIGTKAWEENPPYVAQIKEKFGGLRYYLSHEDDHISSLIKDAEKKASKTCERCGEKGEVYNARGWFLVRCPKHAPEPRKEDV